MGINRMASPYRIMISLWVMLMLVGSTLIGVPLASANNTSYYVDCSLGSNGSGTIGSPWNTLTSVNSHAAFLPGDQILLKKGTTCSGNLAPLGSGSSGSPITIDGYGSSGAAPIINGGGSATATVQLTNQQFWVIQNLEVTNSNPSAGNRIGIRVLNTAGGTLNYIRVLNNYVHNVDGGGSGHGTGGVVINAGSTAGDKFDDVVIQGNSVADVARDGILVIDQNWVAAGQAITNVSITQNVVTRTAGDEILMFGTDGGLIDHNTGSYGGQAAIDWLAGIWFTRAYNTTMQYNESYHMLAPTGSFDSEGFDIDLSAVNNIVQYNYSHDNAGGGFLVCGGTDGTSGVYSDNTTIRYNISQNDVGHGPLTFGCNPLSSNLKVYNNTFYLGSTTTSPVISSYGTASNNAAWTFTNNIIVQLGSGGYTLPGTGGTFDYNVFYGNHPASEPSDAHKSTADPLLVAPGTGGTGLSTVNGYKLRTGSPALSSGVLISGNGGFDYWGNAVSSSAAPNRGAYNGAGISSEILFNPGFEAPQWEAQAAVMTQQMTDLHGGLRGMKASSRSQLFGAVKQDVTDALIANGQGTYSFSAWAKFAASSSTAFVILHLTDSAGSHWYTGTSTTVGTTAFTQLNGSGSVTWTGTLTNAKLYVQTTSSLNDVYTDDFILTTGSSANLVSNPGMEQVQWYGNLATITPEKTNVHSGSNAMKVSGRSNVYSSAAIDIKDILNANGQGTYNYSAWAKFATGSDVAFVIINLNDSTGNHWFYGTTPTVGSTSFTQMTASQNITWTGALTSAILYVQTNSSLNDFYVDDYSLMKQ